MAAVAADPRALKGSVIVIRYEGPKVMTRAIVIKHVEHKCFLRI